MPALPSVTGSGLDLPNLISSLVKASRAPSEKRINAAGSTAKAKLSAIGQIKNALTGLQTALENVGKHGTTPTRTVKLPEHAAASASVSASAVPGRYQVEVVQLATAHKLATGSGHAADHTFGEGQLTIQTGHGDGQTTHEISIPADATLADIAGAINNTVSGKGLTASVVTADDGQHLTLTATDTGHDNSIHITATGAAPLKELADGFETRTAAHDAIVRVDGLQRSAASNTVSDLIPGVTLNLTKAAPDAPFQLDVTTDHGALKSDLETFVKSWNAASGLLKASSAYQPETRRAAILTGDSLVRGLQQQLREAVTRHSNELRTLGISIDKDGSMQFDGKRFESATTANPDALAELFGSNGGYGSALAGMLKHNLNSVDGSLTLRSTTLNQQITDYGKQLNQLDRKMDKLTALYTAQFTAMETMITQMQGSANALGQLLAPSNRN